MKERKPTSEQRAFAAAQKDDLRRHEKMLKLLRAEADDATLIRFAVERRILIPNVEDLGDWPAHRSPKTVGEMNHLLAALKDFMQSTIK